MRRNLILGTLFSLILTVSCTSPDKQSKVECGGNAECRDVIGQTCEDTDYDTIPDTCMCPPGTFIEERRCTYETDEVFTNPCESFPCHHYGDCTARHGEVVFQCHCIPGYTGKLCETVAAVSCPDGQYQVDQTCQPCRIGSYKNWTGHSDTCTSCPPGTTTIETGATNHTQCHSIPRFVSIQPTRGPISGGTLVTFTFNQMTYFTVEDVSIVGSPCRILNQSDEYRKLTCRTGNATKPMFGPVEVTLSKHVIRSTSDFHYLSDPVIHSIDKLKTIISGGIPINVHGQNLNHVTQPVMQIKSIRKHDENVFQSECSVVDGGSQMVCRTASIVVGQKPTRRRRQTDDGAINNKDNHFYLGFKMDGVRRYLNITEALPQYDQFLVYPDPVYYQFEEKDQIKLFNPAEDEFLQIKGEHLNYVCGLDCIQVRIAEEDCVITALTTDQLTCRPSQATSLTGGAANTPGQVTVHAGNLEYMLGYLKYNRTKRSEGLSQVILGVIIAVVALVMILAITITICALYRKRKRQRKGESMENVMESHFDSCNNISLSGPRRTMSTVESLSSDSTQWAVVGYERVNGRSLSATISPPSSPSSSSDQSSDRSSSPSSDQGTFLPLSVEALNAVNQNLKVKLGDSLLDNARLQLQEIIARGYLGKIHKGTLVNKDGTSRSTTTVAVKTVKAVHCTENDVTDFLEESMVMKDVSHRHVLPLLGVAIRNNQPLVVVPYMAHGDLRSYIRDNSRDFKVRELLDYGVEVANGMTYLSSQGFVHKDLAARNCMVDKGLTVKIADFGLSRDIYRTDYYRAGNQYKALPVKWMSVESLISSLFTSKSDVWSFGVLLWELMTRGCTPYPDVDNFRVKDFIANGRRLPHPKHTPHEVYEVMGQCWLQDPDERPSFRELYNSLENIMRKRNEEQHSDYVRLIYS